MACPSQLKLAYLTLMVAALALSLPLSCIGGLDSGGRETALSDLPTGKVVIGDDEFRAWLALTSATRTEGLMWVTDDQIADDQAMLFVFDQEQLLSFWMKNTLIPLDNRLCPQQRRNCHDPPDAAPDAGELPFDRTREICARGQSRHVWAPRDHRRRPHGP